ncbi:acylneuraminate cytidylyltransferase family protein [Litoricolaceae bacterium]|nr:acylneuraminate cytidylyltransferase family protein [Litorivicinaceae bacterium]
MIYGHIGARRGSQGLKSKNSKCMLGKPLIQWSIEQALQCGEIDKVFISTDDPDIADLAISLGCEVPGLRPGDLATSEVGKFQVWQHSLCEFMNNECDIFVDLDCTSPLRDVSDITNAIKLYRDRDSTVDAVMSVAESRKNPYFNMVEERLDGTLMISKLENDKRFIRTRQTSPRVLDHVASIYVLDPGFIRRCSHLMEGRLIGYDIGVDKSFDIDSAFDFALVEFLMRRKHVCE